MPSIKPSLLGLPWQFSAEWNKAIASIPERPLVARSHIWASELGGSYIDRYLKMNAVKMTNPPNERSKRKFVAGHIWEAIVGMVLTSVGLLKQRQLRCEVELPGLLKVTGKLDFVAGGDIDWKKAKEEVKKLQSLFQFAIGEIPPFIQQVDEIVNSMEKKYGKNRLHEVVFECKSVSSFMSDKIEKTGAMSHHILQNFHYVYANKMEGYLFYICKDDVIGHQFEVPNNKEIFKLYAADVKQMTEYYNAGFNPKKPLEFAPPKEPELLFSEGVWRFERNFKVEYSSYLSMLYGYETPEKYRLRWQRSITSWNRVFKRCVRNDNMTPNNYQVIREAIQYFPQWDKYVQKAKAAGAFAVETEEVESE